MNTGPTIESLKATADFREFHLQLAALSPEHLAPHHYGVLHRKLRSFEKLNPLKIAYLGNFVMDPLVAYVNVSLAREGIQGQAYLGGYNQYFQELAQEKGALDEFDPDILFLALHLKTSEPELHNNFSSLGAPDKSRFRERLISGLKNWISLALAKTKAVVLLGNFPSPDYPSLGIADSHEDLGEAEFYAELNLEILRSCKGRNRVQLFDLEKLSSRYGKSRVLDPKMFYLAKMAWSEGFLPVVAMELTRYCRVVRGLTKKCLVLDLDNTLWGGVVGEDGPMGIKVGQGNAEGEAFLDFQYRIKALKDRGIILAICSKNNPEDVNQAFEHRPGMPLRLDDFSAMEINWDPKHENLKRIARKLNIGTDSLVFIDDNPAECSLVGQMCPEIKTILLPPDPADYPGLLARLSEFEKTMVLKEDREKTEQYLGNKKRDDFKSQVGDLRGYLESLETAICIRRPETGDLARVHELFNKTNQFNLTTIRYSLAQVEELHNSPDHQLMHVSAQDRFGDLGVIAVYLLKFKDGTASLECFLMSCRALGRQLEAAVMNRIKADSLLNGRCEVMDASFVPTAKNKPAEKFLSEQGFALVGGADGEACYYRLKAEDAKLTDCDWIKVTT